MLTFDEALAELAAAERFGTHPSLEGTRALAQVLSDPQDAYRIVQVTGTNGKSSTTRIIAALLKAHGVRTGAYLSPELESMTERIEIAGEPVSEHDFARGISAACEARDRAWESGLLPTELTVTQFELLTAAALWLFRARRVRIAVLEVGMGGRWDATSIATPAVAVVTGVGIDHTEQLGETREAIAEDKSNIIKPGSVAVLGPGTAGVEEVLLARARVVGAGVVAVRGLGESSLLVEPRTVRYDVVERPNTPGGSTRMAVRGIFSEYGDLAVRAPAYQAENIATAMTAVEVVFGCGLDAEATRGALGAIDFPGRFELLADRPDAASRHPRRQGRPGHRRGTRAAGRSHRGHSQRVASGARRRSARRRRRAPHGSQAPGISRRCLRARGFVGAGRRRDRGHRKHHHRGGSAPMGEGETPRRLGGSACSCHLLESG
jgi:dihydrofolate synthase/folylpolyglutamate synthase